MKKHAQAAEASIAGARASTVVGALPRYVELLRVSTDAQAKANTPQDQRDALDNLRRFRPGTLVEVIEIGAKGLSGALGLADRPDLQRLRALAFERKFDEVRVRYFNRIMRVEGAYYQEEILNVIRFAGAVIVEAGGKVYDPSTLAGRIESAVAAEAAANERKEIIEKTAAGCRREANRGRFIGRIPWGRAYDPEAPEGKRWSKTREAALLERMVREIIAGKGAGVFARECNEAGIPSPGSNFIDRKTGETRPRPWTSSTVSQLLHMPHMIGKVSSWHVEFRCPPICTPEEQARAIDALSRRDRGGGHKGKREPALLRGLAVCDHCGSPMWVDRNAGNRRHYYRCSATKPPGTPAKECRTWAGHMIEDVDSRVRAALLEWRDGRAADLVGMVKGGAGDPQARIRHCNAKLKRIEREEDALLRFVTDSHGSISKRAADKRGAEIARARRAAEAELAEAEAAARAETQAAAAVATREKAFAEIRASMRPDMPFSDWRAAVEALLPRGAARIRPDGTIDLRLRAP